MSTDAHVPLTENTLVVGEDALKSVEALMADARLPPVELGTELTVVHEVEEKDLAATQRSGGVKTLSTARLLELVESACVECVAPYVEEGYITIGNCVQLRHKLPVPLHSFVQVKVTLAKKLRRAITFDVKAVFQTNTNMVVAEGFHQRSYVSTSEIDARLHEKDAGRPALDVGLEGLAVHYVGDEHVVGDAQGATAQSVTARAVTTSTVMKWCEEASINALEEALPLGKTSVGGEMLITHKAPSMRGMVVTCRARVVKRGPRKITFEVVASDRHEAIAKATHVRFVVDRDAFEQQAQEQISEQRRNSKEIDDLTEVV